MIIATGSAWSDVAANPSGQGCPQPGRFVTGGLTAGTVTAKETAVEYLDKDMRGVGAGRIGSGQWCVSQAGVSPTQLERRLL